MDELDRGCSQLLESEDYSAALILPDSLKIGLKVLCWLDDLRDRFAEKKLNLCIICNKEEQLEAIDLSHPDQTLPCFKDITELSDKLNVPVENDFSDVEIDKILKEIDETKKEPGTDNLSSVPAENEETTNKALEPFSSSESVNSIESILPVPGTVQEQIIKISGEKVETAGEYRCLSCGHTRMWMKGDTFSFCVQECCAQKDKGWQLTFILF
jgi:hypothetical protein